VTLTPRTGLAAARAAAGLTQQELAERTGVPAKVIGFYETGRREPGVDAALALARGLGVSVEDAFSTAPGTEAGRKARGDQSTSTGERTDAQR
jgi:putative transcriptional regulator